jgi:hypothetical protein
VVGEGWWGRCTLPTNWDIVVGVALLGASDCGWGIDLSDKEDIGNGQESEVWKEHVIDNVL